MADELSAWEAQYGALVDNDDKIALLNTMLAKYPLLYGYWLKLIELSPDPEKAWNRALANCKTIDLWSKYLETPYGSSKDAAQKAVDLFGYHFQSFSLWKLLYERTQNDPQVILDSTNVPLYHYANAFSSAYEHKVESIENLRAKSKEIAAAVHARWGFESRLKRPYFHPLVLDSDEQNAWNEYIDFVTRQDALDERDVQQLFERCLVTTALYPQFWIRYICWLDKVGKAEDRVFLDALHYHNNNRVIRRLYSRHLEIAGKLEEGRAQLDAQDYHYLVQFDLRNKSAPQLQDPVYAVEYAKQTGKLDEIPEDVLKASARDLFNSELIEPAKLFPFWQAGQCPDSEKYAARLRKAGNLDMFFTVDSTLGYYGSI